MLDSMAMSSGIRITVAEAAGLIKSGEIVAFPTETVYGLGASASNPFAVEKVFQKKSRPADHPLIVHLARAEDLAHWADGRCPAAHALAHAFWPGPLTLIVKKAPHVHSLVTGGQDTIGLRLPNHPLALELLRLTGPLAAPSANRYQQVSPTSADHVCAAFPEDPPPVVDGGPSQVGVESTIVDLTNGKARVLRLGSIGREALRNYCDLTQGSEDSTSRAPGTHAVHYVPHVPLMLAHQMDELVRICVESRRSGKRVAAYAPINPHLTQVDWLPMATDPASVARELYSRLHEAAMYDQLVVYVPNEEHASLAAVRDRLTRAARGVKGRREGAA